MLFQSQYYIYTFIVFKCYDYQEEKIIKSKNLTKLRRKIFKMKYRGRDKCGGLLYFFLNKYILLSVRYVIGINNFTYKGFFKKKEEWVLTHLNINRVS